MKLPIKQYWNLLIKYLRPQGPTVALLSVLLLSSIGLQLINPQIVRSFLDLAQTGGTAQQMVRVALLFIGLALVQQLVTVLATYFSENVAWTATNALREDMVHHCLQLDMGFHNAHTPGEMIERVDGDVTALASFFSQFVIQILGNVLLVGGVLVLLFREDWRASLAITLFAIITLFAMIRFRNIAVPHFTAERQANADFFGFLEERLAGTEDIRANGARFYVLHHFFRLIWEQMQKSLKAALMINILINMNFVLFSIGTAAAFGVSAYLFQNQIVTIGTVYLVYHYTEMIKRPIANFARQMQELQRAGASIIRIRELMNTERKVQDTGRTPLPAGPLSVSFQDVTFGYDDSIKSQNGNGSNGKEPAAEAEKEIVLRDLSFQLRPGTVLGLLGRTGSGKTTLTRLLFRLYDPDTGTVALGNSSRPVDLRQVPLEHLRQRVGVVTQNIQLFNATVRDNLTFFDPNIPDTQIMRVIGELGLGEWFQSLPDGLDTILESGGGGLSAGEAQLLAFTRIFLKDPGLEILDEASSRLDPATEQLIERAVDTLVQDRSAIIIAHRLGTVQRADQIMILDNGRICEHSDRSALAADPNSRFSHLLQTGLEEVLV